MKDACACLDRSSWFSELWTCLRQKNSKAAKEQQQSAQYQYQAGSDISVSKYALDGWRLPPLLPLQRSEVQVRCNSPASIKNLKMNPSARCGAGKNYIKYTHTHIHIYIHIYIIFFWPVKASHRSSSADPLKSRMNLFCFWRNTFAGWQVCVSVCVRLPSNDNKLGK